LALTHVFARFLSDGTESEKDTSTNNVQTGCSMFGTILNSISSELVWIIILLKAVFLVTVSLKSEGSQRHSMLNPGKRLSFKNPLSGALTINPTCLSAMFEKIIRLTCLSMCRESTKAVTSKFQGSFKYTELILARL
jgi:hypothetical protein